MDSEKVSRKMVPEKLKKKLKNEPGTGIWAKFRLGTRIRYPPSRPSIKTLDFAMKMSSVITLTNKSCDSFPSDSQYNLYFIDFKRVHT